MPKRERSSGGETRNPLSSARKDHAGTGSKNKNNNGNNNNNNNNSINSAAITKADQTAQSLWHRKSGAGYHLFISYYGKQPLGVVTDGSDAATTADYSTEKSSDGTMMRNGNAIGGGTKAKEGSRGMSRAAKKRRRQKKKANGIGVESVGSLNDEKSTNHNDDALVSCRGNDTTNPPLEASSSSSHPLLQAFASKNHNHHHHHPHLTKFLQALSRPLPLTLRFREHDDHATTPKSIAQFKQLLSTEHSNLLSPVSYDPSKAIYQATSHSSLSKSNLNKTCPILKERIVEASMNGTLARQELGSMLPVLGLRSVGALKRGSKVLDLCASPGSKTLQALEIVAGDNTTTTNNDNNDTGRKRGKVIANDVHTTRLSTLRDAVHRSGLPPTLTSRITYTNHDASAFPFPKSRKLFDAIICDVPCGGDGTIRKDKHILPMWSPNTSNALHGLQLRILRRAMRLVRVGGCVCYSTCSLNPIEDEAVVSAALVGRLGGGGARVDNDDEDGGGDGGGSAAYELLDWPKDTLPGFVRRPGVTDWKVAFYDQNDMGEDEDEDFGSLSFLESYEAAEEAGMGEDAEASFWPDSTVNEGLRLDRCVRLFPQDQDTGGFFIALIKRNR